MSRNGQDRETNCWIKGQRLTQYVFTIQHNKVVSVGVVTKWPNWITFFPECLFLVSPEACGSYSWTGRPDGRLTCRLISCSFLIFLVALGDADRKSDTSLIGSCCLERKRKFTPSASFSNQICRRLNIHDCFWSADDSTNAREFSQNLIDKKLVPEGSVLESWRGG